MESVSSTKQFYVYLLSSQDDIEHPRDARGTPILTFP